MATTARKAVFETPELLEKIIAFLYYHDIVTNAQRVSRFWIDTIAQSPTIQRMLRPCPEAAIHPLGFLHKHTWTSRSAALLIPKPFAPDLPVYPGNPAGLQESYRTRKLGNVWLRYDSPERGICLTLKIPNRNLVQVSSADLQPAWLGWSLTDPRITVAWLELELAGVVDKEGRGFSHYPLSCESVRDPNGLTFGTVLKVAEKIRQSAPVGTKGRENARVLIRFVTEPWDWRSGPADIYHESGSDDDVDTRALAS